MKTQKPRYSRLSLVLILTLAGPALALEETRPIPSVIEVLQNRIDQGLGRALEPGFARLSESRQAPPRAADTATNQRSDQAAAADGTTPPIVPITQQYLSAR
jgi:hypothetical protein